MHLATGSFTNKVLGKGSVLYHEWLRCPGDTSGVCQHPTMLQLLLVANQPQASPISNRILNYIHTAWAAILDTGGMAPSQTIWVLPAATNRDM